MGKVMMSGVAPKMTVPVNLPPIGTALNDMTWEQIQTISDGGKAVDYFNVGDTKNITVDGVFYPVQIIGFNHDTKTDGGTAGITFQLVDCLNDTAELNNSNTNNGGWGSCAMRNSVLNSVLSNLPDDLQNVIKSVNKLTSAGNQSDTISTTIDKLFLLSEVEIFGSTTYSKSGEGNQYAYYKAGNSRIKNVSGSAHDWWERSPYRGDSSSFCYVQSVGNSNSNYPITSNGVSFAFCV